MRGQVDRGSGLQAGKVSGPGGLAALGYAVRRRRGWSSAFNTRLNSSSSSQASSFLGMIRGAACSLHPPESSPVGLQGCAEQPPSHHVTPTSPLCSELLFRGRHVPQEMTFSNKNKSPANIQLVVKNTTTNQPETIICGQRPSFPELEACVASTRSPRQRLPGPPRHCCPHLFCSSSSGGNCLPVSPPWQPLHLPLS